MSDMRLQVDSGAKFCGPGGEESPSGTMKVPQSPIDQDPTDSFATESSTMQEPSSENVAKPPRMQFLLTQMRSHLRSQSSTDLHKKAFLDVVQMASWEKARRVRDDTAQDEDGKVKEQRVNAKSTVEIPDEQRLKEDTGELEVSMEVLRREFKEQMNLLRIEMQTYTDQAVKDLESMILSRRSNTQKHLLKKISTSEQTSWGGGRNLEERHKSLSVPSLVPGKNRGLNRTKTSVTPKVRHSAALARRSKSDTFGSSSQGSSNQTLLETSDFKVSISQGSKLINVAGTLPPSCPLLHPSKNVFHTKGKEK